MLDLDDTFGLLVFLWWNLNVENALRCPAGYLFDVHVRWKNKLFVVISRDDPVPEKICLKSVLCVHVHDYAYSSCFSPWDNSTTIV